MELKYGHKEGTFEGVCPLIEPYGIEMTNGMMNGGKTSKPLIEPYGIEIH